ncbi:hypothetical protein GYMLUDRAFT_45351 [Collybiopsis luxurians FD-317 M1]|uniref:Uncharacterized protein n=1 Tax=Collybiopsis luxurians FD-317 M1 TaxID=944289 RepID=A0A0D0B4E4_9AGAR|nr:hypothetical protein GYMLUDRAFT_45351 [Collybiopsis luxurians FD-317 M1]
MAFLSLARELRDEIYDALLFAVIADPLPSIPPHLIDTEEWYWRPVGKIEWKWRLPPYRGSCYGLMYSCRQIYTEILQSIERHGGLSFELNLAAVGIPQAEGSDYIGGEELWPTWVVFPLCTYPKLQTMTGSDSSSRAMCKHLHVSFKVQSEGPFRWQGNAGLSRITRNLFTMLARFLLYGPLGLHRDLDSGPEWNIGSLSVDITGAGTTFLDPLDGKKLCTVPVEVIKDVECHLSNWIDTLCCSGALSDRVGAAKLAVNREVKREWSIEKGKSQPAGSKGDWALYGWVINRKDIQVKSSRVSRTLLDTSHSTTPRRYRSKFCCILQ